MSDDQFQAEGMLRITRNMLERMNDHSSGMKAELERRFTEHKASMPSYIGRATRSSPPSCLDAEWMR
jgi:hypothetical protein